MAKLETARLGRGRNLLQVRDDGGRGGETSIDCGYIWKVETTAFPGRLDRYMREREESRMTLSFLF